MCAWVCACECVHAHVQVQNIVLTDHPHFSYDFSFVHQNGMSHVTTSVLAFCCTQYTVSQSSDVRYAKANKFMFPTSLQMHQ